MNDREELKALAAVVCHRCGYIHADLGSGCPVASQPPSTDASLRGALENVAAISACVAVVENPESHIKMLSNINAVSTKALKKAAEIASVSQSADVVRMREALEPFAAIADLYADAEDDTFRLVIDMDIDAIRLLTLGACRKARSAIDALVPADGVRETLPSMTPDQLGLAIRLVIPDELPKEFFVRGSDLRVKITEEMARRILIEYDVAHKELERKALAQTEGGKSLTSSDGIIGKDGVVYPDTPLGRAYAGSPSEATPAPAKIKCRWPDCEYDTDCMNGCRPDPADDAGVAWQTVPREPTPEMQRAGLHALDNHGVSHCDCDQNEVYNAMLAAAPTHPAKAVDVEAVKLQLRCAEELLSRIEALIPNWRAFRDIADAVEVTLHNLRSV